MTIAKHASLRCPRLLNLILKINRPREVGVHVAPKAETVREWRGDGKKKRKKKRKERGAVCVALKSRFARARATVTNCGISRPGSRSRCGAVRWEVNKNEPKKKMSPPPPCPREVAAWSLGMWDANSRFLVGAVKKQRRKRKRKTECLSARSHGAHGRMSLVGLVIVHKSPRLLRFIAFSYTARAVYGVRSRSRLLAHPSVRRLPWFSLFPASVSLTHPSTPRPRFFSSERARAHYVNVFLFLYLPLWEVKNLIIKRLKLLKTGTRNNYLVANYFM